MRCRRIPVDLGKYKDLVVFFDSRNIGIKCLKTVKGVYKDVERPLKNENNCYDFDIKVRILGVKSEF